MQQRFLPGLVSGRERWCQGFSEPDAGSDLASLRTKAVLDGSEYVITGHKVWTSYSDAADWCLVLARTDPDVPKHRGLSAFAVPMGQDAITQRPLKMINGITREFGEVILDGARVDAANMIGAPGEGWRLAMTVVSHEREPGELGYVARYGKLVNELVHQVEAAPSAFGAEQRRDLAWAIVEAEMLRCHVSRRLSDRLDGIAHGPEGSVDKLLMTAGRASGRPRRHLGGRQRARRRGRHLAQGVPLQPGPERHGRHLADPTQPDRQSNLGVAHIMSTYDLPDEIQVVADGPIRVITLNRPDRLNATNHVLHAGLAALFPQLDADDEARVAVLTGAGRAFSAGGDFDYLDELARDAALRSTTLAHGRQIVTGMVRCRLPIVAAVNGPAVGLGCSLVALSDIVFMAESAHLADPHVALGLVAADGGPVVWPLLTSLQLAKEYALTGDRIPATAGCGDRPGEPRLRGRSGDDRGDGLRPPARPPAQGRGRGHQAGAQHPDGGGRSGRARLRAGGRGPVVHHARTSGQRRPHVEAVGRGGRLVERAAHGARAVRLGLSRLRPRMRLRRASSRAPHPPSGHAPP